MNANAECDPIVKERAQYLYEHLKVHNMKLNMQVKVYEDHRPIMQKYSFINVKNVTNELRGV